MRDGCKRDGSPRLELNGIRNAKKENDAPQGEEKGKRETGAATEARGRVAENENEEKETRKGIAWGGLENDP